MSIYVIAHKPYSKVNMQGYKTLQVGAYKGHTCGDVFDDEGDNISFKNAEYCELTGLYWLWKNCKDDYVGLCHYRRFFSTDFFGKKPIEEKTILRKLNRHEMIVPFKHKLDISVREQYCKNSGFNKDLEIVKNIILDKCPEYAIAYDHVLSGNEIYFFNMTIAYKQILDAYCEWLFEILNEVENQVDTSLYNSYQKRIYGFLSERLFTTWIVKNRLDVYEMGVINTESNYTFIKNILTGTKRSLLSLRK